MFNLLYKIVMSPVWRALHNSLRAHFQEFDFCLEFGFVSEGNFQVLYRCLRNAF